MAGPAGRVEIVVDQQFKGRDELEKNIKKWNELKSEIRLCDKEVQDAAKSVLKEGDSMLKIVDEINNELKDVPTEKYAQLSESFAQSKAHAQDLRDQIQAHKEIIASYRAEIRIAKEQGNLDRANERAEQIDKRKISIQRLKEELAEVNTETRRYSGQMLAMRTITKDAFQPKNVEYYEALVAKLLPQLEGVYNKAVAIKDAQTSPEGVKSVQEAEKEYEIINKELYESEQAFYRLKEAQKQYPRGSKEYEEITTQLYQLCDVMNEYEERLRSNAKHLQFEQEVAQRAARDEADLEMTRRENAEALIKELQEVDKYLADGQVNTEKWLEDLKSHANITGEAWVATMANIQDATNEMVKHKKSLDETFANAKEMNIPKDLIPAANDAFNQVNSRISAIRGTLTDLFEDAIEKFNRLGKTGQLQNLFDATTAEVERLDAALSEMGKKDPDRAYTQALRDYFADMSTEVGKYLGIIKEVPEAEKKAEETKVVTPEDVQDIKDAGDELKKLTDERSRLKGEYQRINLGLDTGNLTEKYKEITLVELKIKELKKQIDNEAKAEYEAAKATDADTQAKAENVSATESANNATKTSVNVQRAYATGILGSIQALQDLKRERKQLESGTWQGEGEAGQRYEYVRQRIVELTREVDRYNAALSGVSESERSSASTTRDYGRAAKEASKHTNSFRNSQKALDDVLKKAKSTLKHALTNITKYVFGFRSLFFLIRKLRSWVIEGVKNLVQFDSANNDTNKAITELNSSLLFLKNAWGAAVAPVLNVVIPVLNKFIDAIATVGNMIARFFAALTGQATVIQAIKVDVEDYAESLKKAGSGAGSAAKKVKDLHDRLAPFDDLQVLGVDKDKDRGGSGGGAGGLGDDLANIDDMFKRIATDKSEFAKIFEFFDEIKSLVKESGITTALSNLWKAMSKFSKSPLAKTLKEIAKIIAKNAFVSVLSVATHAIQLLADVISGDFDAALSDLQDLLADLTFDPLILLGDIADQLLGTNIGDWFRSVKDAVKSIDLTKLEGFKQVKEAFSGLVTAATNLKESLSDLWNTLDESGFLDMIKGFIVWLVTEAFDVTLQGIATAINLIAGAIQLIADLFNADEDPFAPLNDLKDIMATLTFDPLETIASLIDSIFNTDIAGWLEGIEEKIKNIDLEKVAEAVVDTVNKIKTNFWLVVGIIAAVFEEVKRIVHDVWNKIFESLPDPLQAALTSITHKFEKFVIVFMLTVAKLKKELGEEITKISFATVESISKTISKLGEIFSAIGDKLKPIVNVLIGIMNSFIEGMETVINAMIEAINGVSLDIPDWVPEVGGQTIGFDLKKISLGTIPELAQGAVIPPNREFLAMLGDQKSGTNIEAPLDTIVDAFRSVVGNIQVENTGSAVMQVDGQTFARLMTPYVVSELGRRGYDVKIIGG